ncbi:MAG: hypothetical protein MMC33_007644 [Icmadophila ericetorum]|nr:hypothetical protein [Icmadophila ericetorum]
MSSSSSLLAIVIGSDTLALVSGAIIIAGQNLQPGGLAMTVNGEFISASSSHLILESETEIYIGPAATTTVIDHMPSISTFVPDRESTSSGTQSEISSSSSSSITDVSRLAIPISTRIDDFPSSTQTPPGLAFTHDGTPFSNPSSTAARNQ